MWNRNKNFKRNIYIVLRICCWQQLYGALQMRLTLILDQILFEYYPHFVFRGDSDFSLIMVFSEHILTILKNPTLIMKYLEYYSENHWTYHTFGPIQIIAIKMLYIPLFVRKHGTFLFLEFSRQPKFPTKMRQPGTHRWLIQKLCRFYRVVRKDRVRMTWQHMVWRHPTIKVTCSVIMTGTTERRSVVKMEMTERRSTTEKLHATQENMNP